MVTRPNVSPDAIVDFDHHSDEFNLNELAINADLRQTMPGRLEPEIRRLLVPHELRRGETDRPRRRHLRPQIRAQRRRRRRLPRRDGRPTSRRPTGPGHRRGRRALPPGPTARPGSVLLAGGRAEHEAVHGATSPPVPGPENRRRTDGPGARLRQPGPGHPDHEVDGPALRQLAALRQPLPLRHGHPPRQPRIHRRHLPSPRHDARRPRLRRHPTRQARRRPDQLPHPVRIRRPAPHRRTAAQHPVEPHRRRRRHHHVADRADPAASRHPPGATPTTHRPPRALPHRHRRVPALLLGQPATEPHRHPRRRRPTANTYDATTASSSAGWPPTTTKTNSTKPTK